MASKTASINQIKRDLRRYKEKLIENKIPVKRVILFGSYAKGTAKPWSDIDIAVVSSSFGQDYFDETLQLMRARRDINLSIEPHPFHPDDLKDTFDTLAHEVMRHGQEV